MKEKILRANVARQFNRALFHSNLQVSRHWIVAKLKYFQTTLALFWDTVVMPPHRSHIQNFWFFPRTNVIVVTFFCSGLKHICCTSVCEDEEGKKKIRSRIDCNLLFYAWLSLHFLLFFGLLCLQLHCTLTKPVSFVSVGFKSFWLHWNPCWKWT